MAARMVSLLCMICIVGLSQAAGPRRALLQGNLAAGTQNVGVQPDSTTSASTSGAGFENGVETTSLDKTESASTGDVPGADPAATVYEGGSRAHYSHVEPHTLDYSVTNDGTTAAAGGQTVDPDAVDPNGHLAQAETAVGEATAAAP